MSLEADALPDGWTVARLGEICSLRAEAVQPSQNPDTRFVGLEHIEPGNPSLTRWGDASQVNSSKSKFYADDILYGKLRPYLDKAVLAEFTGICSTDILVFKPSDTTAPQFLAHLTHTQAFLDYAIKSTRGVNHPRTSWASLSEFDFPLPPLPEQRAIARALRAMQEAKDARRRELALERERKAALMQYLFTHGTRGEPTKMTGIGEMPEGWEVGELGEVCNVRYGLGQPPELDDAGVPMIRATDIKAGRIVSETVIRVKKEAIPESRKPYLEEGDIIVVRSGAYTGDVAMYDGRWDKAVAGYDLVVSPSANRPSSEFLSYYLLGASVQSYFRSQRDRSAQAHINADQLRNTIIPLPGSDEQQKIANTLKATDAKIAALEREAAVLEELFRAMLEELMTGRLSATALYEAAT